MAEGTTTGIDGTKDERTKLEKIEAVIARIENGQSERSACVDENIDRSTFRMTALKEQVGTQYVRALYGLAQDQVANVEVILDKVEAGEMDVQTARLLVDTRKWFASKFLPKQYGDKMDVTSDGKALPTPIIGIPKND